MLSLLTIGHSRHPLDRFVALLHQHQVEVLVDVRSQPFSRFAPHFSKRPLEPAVVEAGLRYLFIGDALGGRPRESACYGADGKIDYDRVETQQFYQQGIERLRDQLGRFRVCVMCSEEDPHRCHRRLLIARTLVRSGVEVHHIRGGGVVEPETDFRTLRLPGT